MRRGTNLNHLEVSLDLVLGRERMDVAKLGERQRNHAARAVQLHRAAAEGDHGMNKAEILGLQVVDVPEHLRLGVVRVEDGVGEEAWTPEVGTRAQMSLSIFRYIPTSLHSSFEIFNQSLPSPVL